MHQSGHCRAQSMQTVQFSSLRAITPRARVGGSSRSCGYCTVTVGFIIVFSVTPRPVNMPLISRFMLLPPARSRSWPPASGVRSASHPSESHLEYARREDVHERDRDQPLPRECLELILAQPGVGEA